MIDLFRDPVWEGIAAVIAILTTVLVVLRFFFPDLKANGRELLYKSIKHPAIPRLLVMIANLWRFILSTVNRIITSPAIKKFLILVLGLVLGYLSTSVLGNTGRVIVTETDSRTDVLQHNDPTISSLPEIRWEGEYFNDIEFIDPPDFKKTSAFIDFDWYTSSSYPSGPVDNFAVRWRTCLHFEEGIYFFEATADDIIQVVVDDEVNIISASGSILETRELYISAGVHCLQVDYIELGDKANVFFSFKKSD